ncbi:helix-turn-helix domain-containing protein [Actinotalea sp. K2]|uniref:ArsR/SmtB family transcription factor n=1 Tax=Actinotalea sp. K2 TaxID=2939438 RepID=UPI002017D774|nr:helix-turn-helix domain-containing protein [Actinotalea sp. K2]MCL3863021.1 helix-turn-helix domain-containing protein [Actinotalea sp. K2]
MARAIEIIGNRVRARIVRELAVAGPRTAPEIAQAINARREIVYQHLVTLEAAALVVADEPAGRRHGRTVRWSVQADQVLLLTEEFARYLAGK